MRPNILMPIMIFMIRYYPSYILSGRLTSVYYNHFKIFYLTLLAAFTFLLYSCEEGPSVLGTDILPGSDLVAIKSTDTVSVFSYTYYQDSVKSDNPTFSFLGNIYDPYFGLTTADVVTQLRLGSEWNDSLQLTIDSVKLNLRILEARGSTDGDNYLRLSEIDQQLYLDSTYYSNRQVPLTGYVVPDIRLPQLRSDTINEIQVDVPVVFGDYLTRDVSKLFHDNSRPDFRSFFKGLDVSLVSLGDPLFLTVSFAPPNTLGANSNYFTLFMSDAAGTVHVYYFILDAVSKNARFNRYFHDFTVASPDKKILHMNDGKKDTLSYLQGLNGVYTRILLPGLEKIREDLSTSKIAVNKARLIVPIYNDGGAIKGSSMPYQLFIRFSDSKGVKYLVPDYNPNNKFFDGIIDTTAMVCKFNLASYVQGYLKDTKNEIKPELEIFVPTSDTKNVIIKANNSTNKVKFEFTYTKF